MDYIKNGAKKSCGIFTNIAPLYTEALWDELRMSPDIDYFFYSSVSGFDGIRTIDNKKSVFAHSDGKFHWRFLRNIYFRSVLVLQPGLVKECLKTNYDAYIFSGEMFNISCWIAALICKWRKRKILFWGHGLYGDEKLLIKKLRKIFNGIPDANLIYGDRAARLMIEYGIKPERVFVCYNSLDYKLHKRLYLNKNAAELSIIKQTIFKYPELPIVVFIGRLTREKKISHLLRAIGHCLNKGNKYNCLIVGGGKEYDNLRNLAIVLGICDFIYFYGPSYDETINSNLLMISECCVSPGNVGLTAIHSMSLGIPVITHDNMFNQGPEAEAVIQNSTGLFFKEDDIISLSETIDDMILNEKKKYMEQNCIQKIIDYWNPSKQAKVFDEAILTLTGKR